MTQIMMMKLKLYTVIRWILAAIFLYAGMSKLYAPQNFALIIEAYGLLPDDLIMPVAVLLPLFEVIAAIGLIFDIRGSLLSITGLLVMFIVILGYGIHMELDVDCGCFSPGDPEWEAYSNLRPALYKDMIMLVVAICLYVFRFKLKIVPMKISSILRIVKFNGGNVNV